MLNTPYEPRAEAEAYRVQLKKQLLSGVIGTVTPNVGGIPQINGADITENGYYFMDGNGDYGTILAVDLSDKFGTLEVRNIETTAVYSMIETPLSIVIDATPTTDSTNALQSGGAKIYIDTQIETNKNKPWTAKAYASGEQVYHLGRNWVATSATISTDIPKTSPKWVDVLTATNTEFYFETTATKQVKIYGDWKTGDVLYLKVRNLAVVTTGIFNAQLWDWDNSASLSEIGSNNTVKVTLTANTKTLGLHFNLTGTVTSAYCVMALYDSLIAQNTANIATNTANIASKVNTSDIRDMLTSTSPTTVLSGNQGRLLNEKIAQGIPNWSATSFVSGDEVSHLGRVWRANTTIISTDVPSISPKWDNILVASNEEVSFNTTATKQVKLYGDWKSGEVVYFKVRNIAVVTTGTFNAQLWDWDNSISYSSVLVNGTVKVTLTANTKVLGLHLNLTGTVTSAYCVMGLYDSLIATNRTDIATNATNIANNAIEISLTRLNNGLRVEQTTAQKIIKIGTIEAGNNLRLEVANMNIVTTGAYNFQVFQLGGGGILGILYLEGIVDAPVIQDGEIWVVINITGTITTAEYDIKLTSSLSAIEDRNSKAVIKFQDKANYGFDYNSTGYTAYPTLALFSYENANADKEGILQKITLNVAVAGTFTFAIGTLDQRPWAIISKEFDVFTNVTGKQTFDVSDKFLTVGENDYLFVYTKKNGTETINYKDYPSANSNPNFIFGSPEGQILPNSSTYGGGLDFTWDVIPLTSYFASKKDLEGFNSELSNVSVIANSAFNSIAKVSDLAGNFYRMVVVDGAISLQSLNFQRVMVIGNSLLTGLSGRGLACTVPANDFASQLLLGIQAKYAPATMTKISAANWERDLSTDSGTLDTLFASASGTYDLIVIRLGENVNDIPSLQGAIEGMIDYLKADYPLATFLVTSTVLDFTNSAKNTALSTAASNKQASYIAINGSTDNYRIGTSRMYTNGSNVIVPSDFTILTHSNDLGFLFTANSMLSAVGYDQLNRSFGLNVTASVTADYPTLGVQGGIVTIKTYGGSAPTISVNGGAIAVTHYQLSTFIYDNRLINGTADTATYSSTFIMPASAVTIIID